MRKMLSALFTMVVVMLFGCSDDTPVKPEPVLTAADQVIYDRAAQAFTSKLRVAQCTQTSGGGCPQALWGLRTWGFDRDMTDIPSAQAHAEALSHGWDNGCDKVKFTVITGDCSEVLDLAGVRLLLQAPIMPRNLGLDVGEQGLINTLASMVDASADSSH